MISLLLEIIKNCVPQKEVTIRLKDKVWFNSELRREIRKRDRLFVLRGKSGFDVLLSFNVDIEQK
jgi:hypothetical protein